MWNTEQAPGPGTLILNTVPWGAVSGMVIIPCLFPFANPLLRAELSVQPAPCQAAVGRIPLGACRADHHRGYLAKGLD